MGVLTMDDAILTRQEMAKKIVGLRDIRMEIEQMKLRAKNTEQHQAEDFQKALATIENNYDLYKAKLTEFAVSDDEELRKIKDTLDQVWKNLQSSVEKMAEMVD